MRKTCHLCGRTVAPRFKLNGPKFRLPHKCPHGEDCPAGSMNNNMPTCFQCRVLRVAEEGVRRERRRVF